MCRGIAKPAWKTVHKAIRAELRENPVAVQSLGINQQAFKDADQLELLFRPAKDLHFVDYERLQPAGNSTVWLTASGEVMAVAVPIVSDTTVEMTDTERLFLPVIRHLYRTQRSSPDKIVWWHQLGQQLRQLQGVLQTTQSYGTQEELTRERVFEIGLDAGLVTSKKNKKHKYTIAVLTQRGIALARTKP
jgi:hypothetical protein